MKEHTHRPPLIGLAGLAGSGKSVIADILYARHGFQQYAIADNVREALLALDPMLSSETSLRQLVEKDGWDAAKTHRVHGPEVRRLMQKMGTEVGRVFFGTSAWTSMLADEIARMTPDHPVVIDDIHYDDEADWLHRLGGQVWRVVNPTAGPLNDHPTEAPLSPGVADHFIVFDGDVRTLTHQIDKILTPTSQEAVS